MAVLDDICQTTNNVGKTNGAKCHGRMHGWGWSPSFEPGKAGKRYKPRQGMGPRAMWVVEAFTVMFN